MRRRAARRRDAARDLSMGCGLAALLTFAPGAPASDTDVAARSLEQALAPHAWMASRPTWPCRFAGQVSQTRRVGERALDSDGRFFQDCEGGLVWLVETPRRSAEVFATDGNFLRLDRRARPRVLDGLAERRIGELLLDLFAGDSAALARDFAHRIEPDGTVRLQPRAASLARHLTAIDVRGDATATAIAVHLQGQDGEGRGNDAPALSLRLSDWRAFEPPSGDGDCLDALGTAEPGSSACDALRRPARYLERARAPRH